MTHMPRRYWVAFATTLILGAFLSVIAYATFVRVGDVNAAQQAIIHKSDRDDCVRAILVEYEEARDAYIYANTQVTREEARKKLEKLYFPDGPQGPYVTRDDLVRAQCPQVK